MRRSTRTIQLGLRLTQDELEAIERRVEEANEQAHEAGLPATITVSSLVRMWIQEALGEPIEGPQTRVAPNVAAARRKLREGRSR